MNVVETNVCTGWLPAEGTRLNDATWLRQARRLRFDDPATEARFTAHDDERSLRQWRIATALGAAVVITLGLLPAVGMKPWQEEIEGFGRFGLMLPWFFIALGFSWWRAQRHRMQLVGRCAWRRVSRCIF